jgi:hypothetical protein
MINVPHININRTSIPPKTYFKKVVCDLSNEISIAKYPSSKFTKHMIPPVIILRTTSGVANSEIG